MLKNEVKKKKMELIWTPAGNILQVTAILTIGERLQINHRILRANNFVGQSEGIVHHR